MLVSSLDKRCTSRLFMEGGVGDGVGDGVGVMVSMTFSLGAPPVDDRSGGFVVSVG